MARYRLILIAICIFFTSSAFSSEPLSRIKGEWVIKRVIPTTNTSALSQDEVDEIIGTHLNYSQEFAKSGKVTISSPVYSCVILSDQKFYNQFYNFPLSKLGINKPSVKMITIGSASGDLPLFIGSTILLSKGDPIIEFQGVFFALARK